MSQRVSGYERKPNEAYHTPHWVTRTLLPYIPEGVRVIWEPAAGTGQIAEVLREAGYRVITTDLERDFLDCIPLKCDAIITNPPYNLAVPFILRALTLVPFVVMLLRVDFDSAKTRAPLFDDRRFAGKIILRKRIKWFPGDSGPSDNHAWFVWDTRHVGPPNIAYAYPTKDGQDDRSAKASRRSKSREPAVGVRVRQQRLRRGVAQRRNADNDTMQEPRTRS